MNTDILEKVKKLLRLGTKNSNLHEAEIALKRAFELAQRHNIDVESLDLDEHTEKVAHEWFSFTKRASFLQVRAVGIVASYFNVEVCRDWEKIVYVGKPTDIAIAHYVYDFIVRVGRSELRQYEISERKQRRKMSTGKRKQFTQGFLYGISAQLRKSKEQIILTDSQTALVVADGAARERYMDELIPKRKTIKLTEGRKNRTALDHGYMRGKETNINTPLEGAPGGALLLE